MIADLKPYTEYKESGLPWLCGISPGWRILRGKGVFSTVDIRSETGKEELLSVSASDGVVPRSQKTVTMFKAKSYVGHKLCWPGDLVVNSLWAWMQGLGVSRHHGLISSAYSVYRARPEFINYGRFFHYLLRSAAYKWELQTRSRGVWISRLQLLDIAFMDMPILLPPSDEQAAIVRFLDHANRRIDRFIRAKKKVIALLNEQKKAIIHRAITRGLDRNVPLKPSRISWLGDIPQNYQRTRLGRVCISIRDGTHNPPPAVAGIHRLLSVRNIINGQFVTRPDDRTMTPAAFTELQRSYTVEAGDVVIAIVGATTGKSAVVEHIENVTVQRSLAILRPNNKLIHSTFLNVLISSGVIQGQIKRIMDKYAAQPGIYLAELGGLQVIYPDTDEQRRIVAGINAESVPLDIVISRTEREIALLREYRTRLIADVVTGKLDVREAAKKLPDEAAESGIMDEDEISAGDEEMDESIDAEGEEL